MIETVEAKERDIPFPQRLAIAPATMRKVCGSSASAAVIAKSFIPPSAIINS